MWSKQLQDTTRNLASAGVFVKNDKFDFGFIRTCSDSKVVIVNVKSEKYKPMPTDEVIAEFNNVEEMIKAGWVVD